MTTGSRFPSAGKLFQNFKKGTGNRSRRVKFCRIYCFYLAERSEKALKTA
jgi:hypothetical protein